MPQLTDDDRMPALSERPGKEGKHYGCRMQDVPDSYLVWLYGQEWAMRKLPEVRDYIVRNANVLVDLILRENDK